MITLLAAQFRYVVIDTAPGLTEHTLAVLDQASDAVMVGGMDVPSIRGLAKELDILRQLSLTRMTQHVVVNFADRRSGLTVKDVENVIGSRSTSRCPGPRSCRCPPTAGFRCCRAAPVTPWPRNSTGWSPDSSRLKKPAANQPRHRAWAR